MESPFRERTHLLSSSKSSRVLHVLPILTNSIRFNTIQYDASTVSENGGIPPASNQVSGKRTSWSTTKRVFRLAQETSCHLSPDFQKVVLWNARLRSIAIRSGRRTSRVMGFPSRGHFPITPNTYKQKQHYRNQHEPANCPCHDSRHGKASKWKSDNQ